MKAQPHFDLAMAEITDSPYSLGIHAACRRDAYEGWTAVPPNPYPEYSADYNDWSDGFGDGTEDMIAAQRREREE